MTKQLTEGVKFMGEGSARDTEDIGDRSMLMVVLILSAVSIPPLVGLLYLLKKAMPYVNELLFL